MLTLLSTALSVIFSLVATYVMAKKAADRAKLKESLKALFPGYDWEFTGCYIHLRQVKFRIFCPDGFLMQYPTAEQLLRAELLQRSPQLANVKLELEFLPLSEFPGWDQES